MNRLPLRPFLFAAFLCILPSGGPAPCHAQAREYARKAHRFLRRQESDSAYYYATAAFDMGMARDSLLYFWSEVYRQKGVYDTALLLNYAIKAEKEHTLSAKQLEQRYLIYKGLGWSDRARTMLDSLRARPAYKRRYLLPNLLLRLDFGYKQKYEIPAEPAPWRNPPNSDDLERQAAPHYDARGKLAWPLPLFGKENGINLGLEGTIGRPYFVDYGPDKVDGLDSLHTTLSLFGEIANIAECLSIGYTWRMKRDHKGERFLSNSLTGSIFGGSGSAFVLASAGYDLGLATADREYSHTAWLVGILDRSSPTKVSGANVMIDVSTYLSAPLSYNDTTQTFWLRTIDTLGPLQTIDSLDQSSFIELDISAFLPQAHLLAGMGLSAWRRLPFGKLHLGGKWQLTRYYDRYRWIDYNADITLRDDDQIIPAAGCYNAIHDEAADEYYILQRPVPDGPRLGPIETYRVSRIDNTITVNLSLQRVFGRSGTIALSSHVSRTWSSLPANAPVDIPKWLWGVGIDWRKGVSLRKRHF